MTKRPSEAVEFHTRLMKCALEVDNSRAYWHQVHENGGKATARQAFDEYWFGARSLGRIERMLQDLRVRFDAYPSAFQVLMRWPAMEPDTRRLVCHWHLQLSDPLYRTFSGQFLVNRHEEGRAEVARHLVAAWVARQAPGRWNQASQIKFASKLLSAAFSAGLIHSNRDPRSVQYPRVNDIALTYLMYLLREVEFAGTLLDNPYADSVGLQGAILENRLRGLESLRFRRQGDLIEYGWRYPSLAAWAEATILERPLALTGGGR